MSQTLQNKAISSGIWFTISNFIMKTVGFITTPIFTRLMTKEEFGDFNNFQAWMMMLLYITSFNLEGSLIRATHEHKDDLDSYVFSMIGLSTLSTIIWCVVANLFFFKGISELLSVNRLYLNCIFVYLLFCPAVTIFQNVERFKYRYKWTVITGMIISIGASLLSVIMVVSLPNKLTGRIIGYVIPTLLVGTIVIIYYYSKAKKINLNYWKYALPITLPYIPHLLSMYLLSNMDKVMIKKFCGSEYVALYSLAYTCGMLITILATSVNSAYSPWLADKLSNKEFEKIKTVSVPYVAFFSYFALGAALVTPEILYILGGKAYMAAKYVMPPVAAGCLLQFVYSMYVNIEQYEKKTIGMAFASAAAAIINFVLNYIFIPMYGYIAAAYTTYAGYFFLLIMHRIFVKKINMDFVYNNKWMFIIALTMSFVIFLTNFVLDLAEIRYLVLIAYVICGAIILYKCKKYIVSVLKRRQ